EIEDSDLQAYLEGSQAQTKASTERWRAKGKRRYAATLTTAMRKIADDPQGAGTRDCRELLPLLRSLHLRHAGVRGRNIKVRRPAHVVFYRVIRPGLIEIVRI